MSFDILEDEDGTFVLDPLPDSDELEEFYKKKYFQQASESKGPYQTKYSNKELANIHLFSIAAEYCIKQLGIDSNAPLVDIGCGEGFISKYFFDRGYRISAADFSIHGIRDRNPELLNKIEFIQCDITSKDLFFSKRKFPIIICRGVMEHVRDINALVDNFNSLISHSGILVIYVPNDRGPLINRYRKRIGKGFTDCLPFCPPEHIRYFTHNSLEKLMKRHGFKRRFSRMATLPVEAFLLSDSTDYYSHKEKGKTVHDIRCQFAEELFNSDPLKIVNLLQSLGELNMGRDIVHCYSK